MAVCLEHHSDEEFLVVCFFHEFLEIRLNKLLVDDNILLCEIWCIEGNLLQAAFDHLVQSSCSNIFQRSVSLFSENCDSLHSFIREGYLNSLLFEQFCLLQ